MEEPVIAETEISGNLDSSTSKPIDQSDDPNRTTEVLSQEREKLDSDQRDEEGAVRRENPEFWHGVLVHRYDYEVERMNNLKSQSTFILGAVGLINTLLITIYIAAHPISIIYNIILAIIVGIFFAAGSIASKVFIIIHGWRYCLAYPSNEHITIPISLDKLNSDLVSIIQRNSYNNDNMVIYIRNSLKCLTIGVISLIIPLAIVNIIFLYLIAICVAIFGLWHRRICRAPPPAVSRKRPKDTG